MLMLSCVWCVADKRFVRGEVEHNPIVVIQGHSYCYAHYLINADERINYDEDED